MNVTHANLYSFLAQHPLTEADVKWHFNPEIDERLMVHAAIDFTMSQEALEIMAAPERNLVEQLPFIAIKDDSRKPPVWPDRTPPVAAVNADLTHPFFHQKVQ